MELRFESENHTTVKVKVKILYVKLKTYTTMSNLFIRAKLVSVKNVNIQCIIDTTSRVSLQMR